jgi:Xaa-Pro aminopeptidase
MQKAADIAAEAHVLAMKSAKPGMNESQIEAIIEHHFRMNGAAGVSYNSIIGGGANATILHYVENNAPLKRRRFIIDRRGRALSRLRFGHHAHVSGQRQIYKAQREVYDIVLEVEIACLEATRKGNTIKQRQDFQSSC